MPSFRLCIDHIWFCVFLILWIKNDQIKSEIFLLELLIIELQLLIYQLIALKMQGAELIHLQFLQHWLIIPSVAEPHIGFYLEVHVKNLILYVLPWLCLIRRTQ